MLDAHLRVLLTGRRVSMLASRPYNAALLMFQRHSNLNLYNLLNTVIPACFSRVGSALQHKRMNTAKRWAMPPLQMLCSRYPCSLPSFPRNHSAVRKQVELIWDNSAATQESGPVTGLWRQNVHFKYIYLTL